ncbi:unnamed protein product [Boreogadus saida]
MKYKEFKGAGSQGASCPLGPACSSPGLAPPLLASTSARGPRLHQGDGGRPRRPGERVAPPRAVSGPLRASHRAIGDRRGRLVTLRVLL